MNRKLVYLFVVLVAGLFVISSCQQEVGGRVNNNVRYDGQVQGNLQAQYAISYEEQVPKTESWLDECRTKCSPHKVCSAGFSGGEVVTCGCCSAASGGL